MTTNAFILSCETTRHVGRLLAEAQVKPHASQVLADSPPDEQFDEKVEDITGLYINAIESYTRGRTHNIY